MRFLKGDITIHEDTQQTLDSSLSEPMCDEMLRYGVRLLRTAREEWDAKHAGAALCGGMRNIAGGVWPAVPACTVCGPRPTDPRPDAEIAALKAGKAAAPEPAPQMTPDAWYRGHPMSGDWPCGANKAGASYCGDIITYCPSCGPRPPAQPVATEWKELVHSCMDVKCGDCPISCEVTGSSVECTIRRGTYEHRWPSGIVGEGQPEFRRVEQPTCSACAERFAATKILPQCDVCACSGGDEYAKVETAPAVAEPAPAVVEQEHVHLRELPGDVYSRRHEGPHAECPNCLADFPYEVVDRIDAGTLDCPSCGWHSGRCDHCHELLVGDYRIGERDHGRTHCPRCQGVDE